jgi:hypothetical protein
VSILKSNQIATNDTNNVAMDNSLNLKSYTTTQRDALTSVAGDTIYNTTTSKIEFYDGSAWQQGGGVDAFSIEYLVIAGGGGGNTNDDTTHGSGGAGGYLCNVSGENSGGNTSAQPALFIPKSTNLQVSVGAGGGLNSAGSKSEFTSIMSVGGGTPRVASYNKCGSAAGPNGRTSGGPTAANTNNIAGQGSASGQGVAVHGSGGAGGAGAAGSNGTNGVGGDGGDGLASSITGSSVTRGGGGGGGGTTGGDGGAGGGGNGGSGINSSGTSGTANTGGGGGGSGNGTGGTPGSGGSGVVILRWATADATIGGTRSGLTDGGVQTDGSDSYIVFTAGTGTVTFS